MADKRLSELSDADLEVGRKAVEDALIDLRDARISVLFQASGLVVREADGTESSIIRMSTAQALRVALAAIAKSEAP